LPAILLSTAKLLILKTGRMWIPTIGQFLKEYLKMGTSGLMRDEVAQMKQEGKAILLWQMMM